MNDEGVLDPWVAEWIAANPQYASPLDDFSPEILELARGPYGPPPTIEHRRRRATTPSATCRSGCTATPRAPTGLVVYFHGGGFVIGQHRHHGRRRA